jgi:hypothetical protein
VLPSSVVALVELMLAAHQPILPSHQHTHHLGSHLLAAHPAAHLARRAHLGRDGPLQRLRPSHGSLLGHRGALHLLLLSSLRNLLAKVGRLHGRGCSHAASPLALSQLLERLVQLA